MAANRAVRRVVRAIVNLPCGDVDHQLAVLVHISRALYRRAYVLALSLALKILAIIRARVVLCLAKMRTDGHRNGPKR